MSSPPLPTPAVAAAAVATAAVAAGLVWRRLADADARRRDQLARVQSQLKMKDHALRAAELELAEMRASQQQQQKQEEGGTEAPPRLYRVVLTGGPCGGKTTALTEIKARLEALGFLILCVPEAATLMFGNGARVWDESSAFVFQRNLIRLQLALEDAFAELAVEAKQNAVVLCDRGAMDGKAYMSDEQWELLLEELRMTPVALRDERYDAVLHLVTAADGAESYYTLANNATRTETAAEARGQDRKTLDCWTGHEHLYIVDNSTPFDEKIRRAVARISKLVGAPAPLQVTRKFLLASFPTLDELHGHVKRLEVFDVEQTYLLTHAPNERCRVRRRQQGANVSYMHQTWTDRVRDDGTHLETTLIERTIKAREYTALMKQADPRRVTVSKTLACFTWGSTYWELNSFRGDSTVAILEVEAERIDTPITMPPFVATLREVTDEFSYDSYALAQKLAERVEEEVASPNGLLNGLAAEEGGVGAIMSSPASKAAVSRVVQRSMSTVLTQLEDESSQTSGGSGGSGGGQLGAASKAMQFARRLNRKSSSFGP